MEGIVAEDRHHELMTEFSKRTMRDHGDDDIFQAHVSMPQTAKITSRQANSLVANKTHINVNKNHWHKTHIHIHKYTHMFDHLHLYVYSSFYLSIHLFTVSIYTYIKNHKYTHTSIVSISIIIMTILLTIPVNVNPRLINPRLLVWGVQFQ